MNVIISDTDLITKLNEQECKTCLEWNKKTFLNKENLPYHAECPLCQHITIEEFLKEFRKAIDEVCI